jgi:molybdopterin molybdotransferase
VRESHDIPQRIARLAPIEHVLARIDALVRPVEKGAAELRAALGRTLAEEVLVDRAIPETALALRDGWAVKSDLTTDAGPYALAPVGAALRIETGQPLPADTDAVAPFEAVAISNGLAQALSPVGPGEGVLAAGADAIRGRTLVQAGRRLDGVRTALLAAMGLRSVQVREPRVLITRARPESDRIIDAAVECMVHAARCTGALAKVSDSKEPLEHALTQIDADAVIVIGGTGCGRNDTAVATLASLGQVEAHGIGLIPAETAAFAMLETRPVLALPGRLDAALAAWHLLGRAVVARLAGSTEPPSLRAAQLTRKAASIAGLAELVPVRCEGRFAHPLASGYLPISALAQANGWLFIEPGSEGYQAQSEVVIRPWP